MPPKPCNDGFERNPVTGRCIKSCKPDQERNPTTGRCNKIKLGNRIPPMVQPQPPVVQPQPPVVQPQPTIVQPQPTIVQPQSTIVQPPVVQPPLVQINTPHFFINNKNPVCKFGTNEIQKLTHFFKSGVNCSRNTNFICDSGYKKQDMCLQACEIVRQYGQGFSFRKLMQIVNQKLNKNFTSCFPSKIFARGSVGIVLSIILSDGTLYAEYALKISKITGSFLNNEWTFQNENRLHNKFYDIGAAVLMIHNEIFGDSNCPYKMGIILMEKIDFTYDKFLKDQEKEYRNFQNRVIGERQKRAKEVSNLIMKCKKHGLTHGDLHTGNIAFIRGGKEVRFIDFGRSTDFYANSLLDYSAFVWSEPLALPDLYENSSSINPKDMIEKHDPVLKKLLSIKLSSNLAKGEFFERGSALGYKIFLMTLRPHLNILSKLSLQ